MSAKFEKIEGRPGIYRRGPSIYVAVTEGGLTKKLRYEGSGGIEGAANWKKSLEVDRNRGKPIEPSRKVFADWLPTEWLPSYRGRSGHVIADRTKSEYERQLRKFVIPWLKRTRMHQISRPTIKQLIAHLQNQTTAGGEPLSDASVRQIMTPVRAALADAAEDGLIAVNPAAGVPVPTRRQIIEDDDDEGPVKVLTRSQLAQLIAAVPERHRTMLKVLGCTGLRIGECVALRWRDVDLSGPEPKLRVRRAVKRVEGGTGFGPPKSAAGKRTIPLPASVVHELRERKLASQYSHGDDLVFASQRGTVLSLGTLNERTLHRARKQIGLPSLGFHSVRHSVASYLLAEGRSIVEVARWMGHTPAVLLSTYAHLVPGDARGPLEMPDVLGGERRREAKVQ